MIEHTAIDELFDSLNRFMRLRDRAAHTTFRSADGEVEIEIAAFKGLFHLARQPMRSRALADCLNADPSTVSRHVAQLVDLGLLRREADPDDGRATLLVITDAGRERVESMRRVRRAALDEAMADWTDHEVHTLVTLFSRFVDAAETAMPLKPPVLSGADSPRADDLVKGR
ncbi:MarR family winged helix-turn-helix transcriptional regulator [Gordonia soli]|uniref:Putative MarR family transcriptional regulator n=1 Tax=Gordonia soli NBRC 108243 TaxID=1223545 RepID=M0QI64_9ACTN|nr:MarR family transcriptional regulator [Gordonia soli]GAC68139.1 putative MarR family transcriptional regulator [Gordonia soli NBRC 108243]